MSDPWLIFFTAFAAYRVTRLVTTDKIAEPVAERIRWWLERRWQAKHGPGSDEHWNSKVAYLLSCPWCLGFWVSGAFAVLLSVVYGLGYLVIVWLALSAMVGLLSRLDTD